MDVCLSQSTLCLTVSIWDIYSFTSLCAWCTKSVLLHRQEFGFFIRDLHRKVCIRERNLKIDDSIQISMSGSERYAKLGSAGVRVPQIIGNLFLSSFGLVGRGWGFFACRYCSHISIRRGGRQVKHEEQQRWQFGVVRVWGVWSLGSVVCSVYQQEAMGVWWKWMSERFDWMDD